MNMIATLPTAIPAAAPVERPPPFLRMTVRVAVAVACDISEGVAAEVVLLDGLVAGGALVVSAAPILK